MERKNQSANDADLDALFRAYREACPAPDPSANFMPEIWRRIEARQRSLFFLGRWARAFVTAAAVLSLALAGYLYLPQSHTSMLSIESYVEALSASHSADTPDLVEPPSDEL
jgi:hypothetical protein